MGRRFGLLTEPGYDEQGGASPSSEHVISTVPRQGKQKKKISLSQESVLSLGLDPIELADGSSFILGSVPRRGSRREADEDTRARTRGFEIDRRLFPWNSRSIRAEEFQNDVAPKLRQILADRAARYTELAVATAVAIAAETGRSLEQILDLRVEDDPHSAFAYSPPAPGQRVGLWKWDEAGPLYQTERRFKPVVEVDRAKYLTYPTSELITDLVARLIDLKPLDRKDSRLFPFKPASFRKRVREWLEKSKVNKRITPARISHLIWDVLHKSTEGELASICLVLGLHHPMAQVELFYAVLANTEAATLFANAQAVLWGKGPLGSAKTRLMPDPSNARFTGCREFPRIPEVRRVVKLLREGSEAFFRMKFNDFDGSKHRERFNRAVLYAVWHQFFSFGTRAIVDAYQPLDRFSCTTGFGILSDKDFASGYKTRIVIAPDRLRKHMQAVEKRLALLCVSHPEYSRPGLGPVWLLDAQNQPVQITPSTIDDVLKKEFPLPVNTPRKVMRYLLRKAGMSHSHSEAYMGHWWHGREPFSPYSTFDFRAYAADASQRIPDVLEKTLGFWPVPGVRAK
jgi:hypothetical protein